MSSHLSSTNNSPSVASASQSPVGPANVQSTTAGGGQDSTGKKPKTDSLESLGGMPGSDPGYQHGSDRQPTLVTAVEGRQSPQYPGTAGTSEDPDPVFDNDSVIDHTTPPTGQEFPGQQGHYFSLNMTGRIYHAGHETETEDLPQAGIFLRVDGAWWRMVPDVTSNEGMGNQGAETIVIEGPPPDSFPVHTACAASSSEPGTAQPTAVNKRWQIDRLTRENYVQWQELIQLLMEAEGTDVTITDSYVSGSEPALERQFLLTLKLMIEPTLLGLIRNKSPKEAWKALSDTFASSTELSKIICLNNFNELQLGDLSMIEYLQKKDELGEIARLSGIPVSEQQMMASYHSGLKLSRDFRLYSKTTLEKPGMNVQLMRAALLEEWDEQHLGESNQETGFNAGGFPQRRCFVCNSADHLKNNCPKLKKEEQGRKMNPMTCNYCSKKGHSKAECRKRQKDQGEGPSSSRDNRDRGNGSGARKANTDRVRFEDEHLFAAFQGPSLPWDQWVEINTEEDPMQWGDEPQTLSSMINEGSNVYEVLNFLTEDQFDEEDYRTESPKQAAYAEIVSGVHRQMDRMLEGTREVARKHVIKDLLSTPAGVAFDDTRTHPNCGISWVYDGTDFEGRATRQTVWNNLDEWKAAYASMDSSRSWELQNPLLLNAYLPDPEPVNQDPPACSYKTCEETEETNEEQAQGSSNQMGNDKSWILDSGASSTMSGQRGDFMEDFEALTVPISITAADNRRKGYHL
jgi:hypothetical protein